MNDSGVINRVYVDFENVPSVDLTLIGGGATNVTLLIGEKQRRLDLALVRQIHAHATKVTLVEVGASGRNALDLVLAWHLGKAAERHPQDPFFIVSKDHDFDPLITHLRASGFQVTRVDTFDGLPFLTGARRKSIPARKVPTTKQPASLKPTQPAAQPKVEQERPVDDRLAKVIERLQRNTKARPVRRKTLLSHINGFYSNQLSDAQLEEIAATLERRGIIAIGPNQRVVYR